MTTTPADSPQIHLALALDGAGWHPAAWREPDAVPAAGLFGADYWLDQVRRAEAAHLDFVTIEDGFPLQSGGQVRGRLDAALIAARIAPLTRRIGLVPTITTTHTEPFHVSKVLASLDYASTGRAGWRARIGAPAEEAALFGRRGPEANVAELFAEAADHVEVVRRLWDSWEDDAEIRDAATGRFIDREKLHYIDFESRHFRVRGPSVTPRPPQGQPIVAALAHQGPVYRLAESAADLVFVTPRDAAHAREIRAEVSGLEQVFADLVVFLDEDEAAAIARKRRLDELGGDLGGDAAVFVSALSIRKPSRLTAAATPDEGFVTRFRNGRRPPGRVAATRRSPLLPSELVVARFLRRLSARRHGGDAYDRQGRPGHPDPHLPQRVPRRDGMPALRSRRRFHPRRPRQP